MFSFIPSSPCKNTRRMKVKDGLFLEIVAKRGRVKGGGGVAKKGKKKQKMVEEKKKIKKRF